LKPDQSSLFRIALGSFLLVAAAFGMASRAHAAEDHVIKKMVKAVRDSGLDDACGIKVDWDRRRDDDGSGKEFDLIVKAKRAYDEKKVTFDTCDKDGGTTTCRTAVRDGKHCRFYGMAYVDGRGERATLQLTRDSDKVKDGPCNAGMFRHPNVVAECSRKK
jgi:hypothetical protein